MSDLVLNDDENSLGALQEAMGMSLDLNFPEDLLCQI